MKEFDLMRPKKVYADVLRQREVDGIDFYHQYSQEFVDINCPACGKQGKFSFEKYGYAHKICSYCETLFCTPRPKDVLLMRYYEKCESAKLWTRLLLSADMERKRLQYMPRAERIIEVIKEKATVSGGIAIDIGAGSGAFASCLKTTGFFRNVIAMDCSADCVIACKKSGLGAIIGSITDVAGESCDFISLMDLIEHIFNPLDFLKKCFLSLRAGGFIAIATPNCLGFDFKIMGAATRNITPPEHLNYFNPGSLELLLESVGFTVVSSETPGKLDVEIVLKEKLSGYDIAAKNGFIDFLLNQDETVLAIFQRFISDNNLSSHMLIVARKE